MEWRSNGVLVSELFARQWHPVALLRGFSIIGLLALLFPAAGAAQSKLKFPYSITSKSLGYGPMLASAKLGFMEREDFEPQLVYVRGADKSLAAVLSGSVYVSASGSDAHIAAVERGIDVVMIGGTINGLSQVLMTTKNIQTLNDLRGKIIGATSATSGLGFALRRYFKAKGFEFGRDYQILATGSAGPTLAALAAGQVHAAALGVPLNFVAADQGFHPVGRIIDVIPSYQFGAFTVSRAVAEKNRPLMVRFMAGSITARIKFGPSTRALTSREEAWRRKSSGRRHRPRVRCPVRKNISIRVIRKRC